MLRSSKRKLITGVLMLASSAACAAPDRMQAIIVGSGAQALQMHTVDTPRPGSG